MSKLNRSKIITAVLLVLVAGFSVTSLSYATQTPLFNILPQVAALPTINLAPSSGVDGTNVTITGTGFSGTDTSCVVTGTGIVIGIPPASCTIASSVLSATQFTVGAAAPGTYTITVTGSPGADAAQATFTVLPPTITLSPASGVSKTNVTVTGTHFSLTDATCSITGSVVTSPTCRITKGSGNPSGNFNVSAIPPGIYTVTVTGAVGDTAQASFTIPAPAITLTPPSGSFGTTVTMSGGGFNLGDAGTCVISQAPAAPGIAGNSTCTINTSGQLAGAGFRVVNATTPGTYTITVTGITHDSASASFTITGSTTSTAKITLSPTTGAVGSAVTVTGTGFSLGDTFCNIGPSTLAITPTCTITSGSGAPSGSFFVGGVSPGTYTVTVTGSTGDSAQATFTVAGPKILLSPTSGVTGITETVTGSGFSTLDTTCKITGGPIVNPTPAPICNIASGNVAGSFNVGGVPAGTYSITVTGSPGGDSASATFTVISHPAITLTPSSGPVGAAIVIDGAGFSAADTAMCTISGPALLISTPTCTFITPGNGAPTGSFYIGTVSPGTYTVSVTGSTGDSASATLTVLGPFITLSPNKGPVGTIVSVTGSGFNTGDVGPCGPPNFVQSPSTPSIVTSDVCTIDANGQVTGGFTVKAGATPGTYTLTVTGSSGDSASATFTVTVNTPVIILTPSIGPIGTIVAVTGSGFNPADAGPCKAPNFIQTPSTPVIVTADVCNINSSGQLTAGFTVKTLSTPGVYTLTVTGSTGDSASASFTVTGPFVILTPTSGPIGTHVTAIGGGFDTADVGPCGPPNFIQTPSSPFIVTADVCNINSSGQLAGGFTVANTATPGTYLIQVKGSTGDISDPPFTVTQSSPTIVINPNSAPVGTIISVTGSGFNPADAGPCKAPNFIQTPSTPVIVTADVCNINSSGQLTAGFTIKTGATPGPYTLTVTGSTGDSASGVLAVSGGPSIILTPVSGHQGTSVSIVGNGFSPNDAGTCTIATVPVQLLGPNTCTITSSGTLQATTFSVGPAAPTVSATVKVTGSTGDSAIATFIVTTSTPSLTLTPNAGPVLTAVTMSGSGFNTGDTAACTALSTPTNIVSAATCTLNNGQLTVSSFTVVSTATPGVYVVTVTGSSGDTATAVFTVTASTPTITIIPSSGTPGAAITITGSGFSPADAGPCTSVLSSPTNIVSAPTCNINSTGQLIPPADFTVLTTAAGGTYVITVKGSSGDFASKTFTVSGPQITLVPTSGPVSTAVTITGSGFSTGDAGACTATSTPSNIVSALTCTITSTGAITGSSFTVATAALIGSYVVTVKGSTGDLASATFVVTTTIPSLTLTPNTAPVSTAISMTGTGFNTGDAGPCTSVLSTPSNIVSAPTCTITNTGQLTTSSFTVLSTATPGIYVVSVTGSKGDIATAALTVTLNTATLVLTPNSGPVSTAVTLSGNGFNTADAGPCSSVLSTPSNIVSAPTCTINSGGQLSVSSFTVSTTATPGSYVVTVKGSTGDTGAATFTVTTTAPTITLTPTGGSAGTAVTVGGSGFNSGDAGACTSVLSTPTNIVTASTCTITSSGLLSGSSFTVSGTATPGTYVVTVKGSTGDTGSANFIVTGPHIALSPASGPTGSNVIVTGEGFAIPDTCTAASITSTPISPVLVSSAACSMSNGKITSAAFTVAATASGTYTVTVTGSGGDSASATFTVNPFSPTITVNPGAASDGQTVSITGSGFNTADTTCMVTSVTPLTVTTVFSAAPTCTITAGKVTVSTATILSGATAPPPGTYTVTVQSTPSMDTAEANFVISGAPTNAISLLPGTGGRGSTVGISGQLVCGIGPCGAGAFSPTCSVSGTPVSSFACAVNTSNVISGHFVVSTNVQAGPYTITVSVTPSSGSSVSCNSPLTSTNCVLYAVFIVQGPFIQLSDPAAIGEVISGTTGTHVSIEGSFFPLSDTTCTISQGSGSGSGNFIVNGACSEFAGSGPFAGYNNVTGSFVVGNVQEGQYVVQVSSSGSGTFAQAVFNVTAGAFIQLAGPGASGFASVGKAASGPSGSSIKVSGSQFQPGDVNSGTCSIGAISGGNAIAGGTAACSFFKTPNGFVNVTGSFIVGTATPGQYAIQISGSQGDSAQAILNVTSGAFIQLFPTSGTVGSHVSVEGSNFQPGSTTCTIGVAGQSSGNFIAGGTAACSTFTAANGFRNVTASFTVGNVQPGDYVIQISGSQGEFAQALFTVTSGPFIQLSGASGGFANVGQVAKGPTGSVVHVEGSAFLTTDTSCTVGVASGSSGNFIAGGTSACSTFTAQSGIFKGATNVTASFTIGNVQPGEYAIQISGNQGDFAQAVFEVTGGPFLQVSSGPPSGFENVGQPAKAQVGSHISVEGSNFLTTDTSCTIGVGGGSSGNFIGGGTAACAVFTTNGATNVTASFRVGNVQPGQYLIQVSGNQGDFAQALVNVTSGPFIQLSSGPPNGFASVGQPASGPTGSHVSIEGSDFVSTDTTCTIGVGGGTSGNFISAGSGCTLFTAGNGFQNVTASFTVGNVPPGQYVVQISGNQGDFAQALFNVTSGPVLTISPGSGRLGTDVDVNGTNFLRTDTSCSLSSPTGAIITGGACTIVNGVMAGSFIVGNVLPGQYVIQASGNQGDFGQIIFKVLGGSIITLSPGTGRPGAHIAVNGTGFLPTDSSCSLTSPGTGAVLAGSAACAIVLGSGLTNSSFIIGNVVPGQYLIQISGNQGDFAQAVLNVVGGPSISLNPGTQTIGGLVLVNGTGFLPTDTSCTLVSGASNTNNPITPSSGGCAITAGTGFANASLIVAGVPPGQYVIQITGSSGDSAQAVLNVLHSPSILTLYPTNATVGATVNFQATGLSTSDTSCTVQSGVDENHVFSQNSVVLTAPTCAIGPTTVATGTFVVGPYATEDKNWSIQIRGAPAQDVSQLAVFNVTASVTVTPNSGSINSVFTYTGTGFESTATSCKAVLIPPFPNAPTLGCYFSPGIGQVSGSVIVPRGAFPGTYGIQITDNTGSSATGVFTVGTPTAQLVLNPASQGQGQSVGFAATGLNPNDTYCAVTAGANPPWVGPNGITPTCSISGGYASGAFGISDSATGGYYLVTVTGYAQPPTTPCPTVNGVSGNTCAGLGGGDFAQNFLGVTLATTVTTFSSTTSTSTSTTSQTFTTTSMATSYSYSSSTASTTGILYTTYWHGTSTTVFASTTSTFGITTTTTQSWTSVTVSTTTVQTTGCGPLPCPWAIQPQLNAGQSINGWQSILGPFSDSVGMLAVLLLIVPILLRRLFT